MAGKAVFNCSINEFMSILTICVGSKPRGESWKARAGEREGSVQARTIGITALGVDWMVPTRHRAIARAWKGSPLGYRTSANQ